MEITGNVILPVITNTFLVSWCPARNRLMKVFLSLSVKLNNYYVEYDFSRKSCNKDRTRKDEHPRLVSAQYATWDQWRNNSRKNEEMDPKQKLSPVVDVTGDGSKVWCCKEQHCIGTWNDRSMNQGKLELVKQEMARVNMNILRISELKWINGWI